MKKTIFSIIITLSFISLFSYPVNRTYTMPLQYIESDLLPGIDEYIDITDPLDMLKAYAQFAGGLSPLELYVNLKVEIIYDTDSVLQGDSMTVKVLVTPEVSSKPVIYSNYGICAGVGTEFRSFGPFGGPWLGGPGYGIDFNFNIESEDDPPMVGEEIHADDVVDFLSLVPDMKGAKDGTAKAVMSDKGDTLVSKNKGESGGSDVMGLFDLLSLRLSGGYRIDSGKAYAHLSTDNQILKSSGSLKSWMIKGDTLYFKVYVDSFALNGDEGYLIFEEPYYMVGLKRRMGLVLQSFGFTVASSYWLAEDKWEDMGYRELRMHPGIQYQERRIFLPIMVVGDPVYRADWVVTEIFPFSRDYWGTAVDFVESGVSTQINLQLGNHGSSYSPACSIKVEVEDTTIYLESPAVFNDSYGWASFYHTFADEGEYVMKVTVNYDHEIEEIDYSNNTYSDVIKVVPAKKLIEVAVRDSLGRKTISPVVSCQVLTRDGVFTANYKGMPDSTFWFTAPGNDTILISVITDTAGTDYALTGKALLTKALPIEGNLIDIPLNVFADVEGCLTDYDDNPICSVAVNIGPYSTYTDSKGIFNITKMMPLPEKFFYSLNYSHPVYQEINDSIEILSGSSNTIKDHLVKLDSIAPSGAVTFADKVYKKGPTYYSAGEAVMRFAAYDDFSGMRSVKIRGQYDAVWTEHDFANIGSDSVVYVDRSFTLPPSSGNMKIFYKFVDVAYNESDSCETSLYALSKGPSGTCTVIDTIVYSPAFRVSVSSADSVVPLKNVKIEVAGETYTYAYSFPQTYIIPLPEADGVYEVRTYFSNMFDVYGDPSYDSLSFSLKGKIVINSDDQYTNNTSVSLSTYPMAITSSMVDTSGGFIRGGTPLAQSFIPNTSHIAACAICFASISDTFTVALYSDTINYMGYHTPNKELTKTIVTDNRLGWRYLMFDSSITVIPADTYHLVLYSDSITGSVLSATVHVGDNANYSGGELLYSPTINDWYKLFFDMGFKIYTRPDSMHISNYESMTPHSSYPYQSSLAWSMLSGDGNKPVFAEYFYSGSTPGIISDGIILDQTPPQSFSFEINHGSPYTDVPNCTLDFAYSENYSDYVSVYENGTTMAGFAQNHSIWYPSFSDSTRGVKIFRYSLKDKAGNMSALYTDSIDYNPNGAFITANFNNRSSMYIPGYYPSLNINYSKAVYPQFMRYSEEILDLGEWKPFASSVVCSLKTGLRDHTIHLEVKDNYGKISRTEVSASIDSTPPAAVAYLMDEGDYKTFCTTLSFYWEGASQDPESRLDSALLSLYLVGSPTPLKSMNVNPFYSGKDIDYTYSRYGTYKAKLQTLNNAGLYSTAVESDGITLNNPPTDVVTVSPAEGENVSSRPDFLVQGADTEPDSTLCFKIEVATDFGFTDIVRTFDGKMNTSGWSKARYASGETAEYSVSSADSLNLGETYYWRALCYDSISYTSYSAPHSFYVSFSGIKADFALSEMDTVFRIKTGKLLSDCISLTLYVPFSGNVSLYAADVAGRIVSRIVDAPLMRGGYTLSIKDKNLASGTYFLLAEYKGKKYKEKLILMK